MILIINLSTKFSTPQKARGLLKKRFGVLTQTSKRSHQNAEAFFVCDSLEANHHFYHQLILL